jgi:phage baseplate assembly protein gpV
MGLSALLSTQILDSTATGRSVLTGADASAIKTVLGLGKQQQPTFSGLVFQYQGTGPSTFLNTTATGDFSLQSDLAECSFRFNANVQRTEIDTPNHSFIVGDLDGNGSGTTFEVDDVIGNINVNGQFNANSCNTSFINPLSGSSIVCSATFAIRNGITPRRLEVYGIFSDSSNYRRLYLTQTTGGAATIGVEGLGSGATGNTLSIANNVTFAGAIQIGGSSGFYLRNNGVGLEARDSTNSAQGQIWSSACVTGSINRNIADATLDIYNSNMSIAAYKIRLGGAAQLTNSSGVGGSLLINSILNQTGTAGSTDFCINRTETALGSGTHLFADFQLGGVSQFRVDRTGNVFLPQVFQVGYAPSNTFRNGVQANAQDWVDVVTATSLRARFKYANELQLPLASRIDWMASTDFPNTTVSCSLVPSLNTLAQRNGTNAQRSEIYGTYTDASNYRRLYSTMTTAGAATIGVEGLGTGATGNTLTIGNSVTINGNLTITGTSNISGGGGLSRYTAIALGW